MATKKAIVMGSDGRLQQLQSGDTLGGVSETGQVSQTADATLIAGQACYSTAADHVGKAKADASGTKDVLGLATAAITSAASGTIQCNGILALTTAQWDALCGTTGGLTFNVPYFLSAGTAGLLASTVPTTVGQYVCEVGRALSTTEMMIDIRPPVLL